jgi:hypothetical protein
MMHQVPGQTCSTIVERPGSWLSYARGFHRAEVEDEPQLHRSVSRRGRLRNGTPVSVTGSCHTKEKVLYSFGNGADGSEPSASLVDVRAHCTEQRKRVGPIAPARCGFGGRARQPFEAAQQRRRVAGMTVVVIPRVRAPVSPDSRAFRDYGMWFVVSGCSLMNRAS